MKKTGLLIALSFGFSVILHAQAGQLDSSFGTNGIVRTNISFGPDAFVTDENKQYGYVMNGGRYLFTG
jgi:hypothetical protein